MGLPFLGSSAFRSLLDHVSIQLGELALHGLKLRQQSVVAGLGLRGSGGPLESPSRSGNCSPFIVVNFEIISLFL